MKTIDWDSIESHILINPRCSVKDQILYKSILDHTKHLSGHIWLATSGSTASLPSSTTVSKMKWVGLSKSAILISAQAVNEHLRSTSTDIWIHCLPDFHVGGVGIWARSHLSRAKVIDCRASEYKWNAASFYEVLTTSKGTLTALVPTQIHDLVNLQLKAPKTLRAVIVGGGRLSETLYRQAVELGWNILSSYGMTECSSQVATADIDSHTPRLKILSHMEVETLEDTRLRIKSEALFSAYAITTDENVILIDPKENGWFTTDDVGFVENNFLEIRGRLGKIVKIGGENVSLDHLESILEEIQIQTGLRRDLALVAVPDERLEYTIHLAVAQNSQADIQHLIDLFHQKVLPYERIRKVHIIPAIPRSSLSKVLYSEVLREILKAI